MASRTSSLTCGWRCAACSSNVWTRAASWATRAFSSATVSLLWVIAPPFIGTSRSERDQAMLLRRPRLTLGREVLQRTRKLAAGIRRLDDVIDQTTCGRHVRRRERVAVQLHQLRLLSDRVIRGSDLPTERHPVRSLGTHH